MKKRVISAIIMVMIVVPILYFGGLAYNIGIAILSIIALKELLDLKQSTKIPHIMMAISLVLMLMFTLANSQGNALGLGIDTQLLTMSAILLLVPAIFLYKRGYNTNQAFYLLAITIFVGMSFNSFILVYETSKLYFLWLLIIACMTDIFALFGGKLIGRNKLSPNISPNKTIEGAAIGTVVAVIVSTTFYNIFIGGTNLALLIVIEVVLSLVGQAGDLFFSLIKRENNIKDYSNLIPGHGGILDRLDSIIFIVNTFAILMHYV